MDKVTIPGYSIAQLNELQFSPLGHWYLLDNCANIIGFMFNGSMQCTVTPIKPNTDATLVLVG